MSNLNFRHGDELISVLKKFYAIKDRTWIATGTDYHLAYINALTVTLTTEEYRAMQAMFEEMNDDD